jgi:hypothetical protein
MNNYKTTFYQSLNAKYSPACSAFISRCLVTALNNEEYSYSMLMSLLSGEYPTTPSPFSLPCRTQLSGSKVEVKVTLRLTDSHSVSKSWCRAPFGAHDQLFITVWQLRSFLEAPSPTRGRVCLLGMLLALASAVFSGSRPLGLATVFYYLRFETFLFVTSAWVVPIVFPITPLHGLSRKHHFQQ